MLNAIDLASGVQTATLAAGGATFAAAAGQTEVLDQLQRRAARSAPARTPISSIVGTGNALSALGLTGNTGTGTSFTAGSHRGAPAASPARRLTFTSFNGGAAVNVTFGDGTNGTVKTLDQLNAALLANNLAATARLDRQADDHRHRTIMLRRLSAP